MLENLSRSARICGSRAHRARYAILTILAPTLIVLGAWLLPHVLRGLLLLSLENGDLFWLTWMSSMVVALGLSIYRVIQLHGDARMGFSVNHAFAGSRPDDHASLGQTEADVRRARWFWSHDSIGWPIAPTIMWILASLSYPVAAALESVRESHPTARESFSLTRDAVVTVLVGMLLGAISLIALSLLRTMFAGHRSAPSGLYLGEGFAQWAARRFGAALNDKRLPMLRFPIRLAGVTDEATKRLLPGHTQLLIAMTASVAVYVGWYFQTVNKENWSQPDWPVGFYLLLLIYCTSAIVSFLAFFLDRYYFPVTLAAFVYVALFADAHRYYELEPAETLQPIASALSTKDHLLIGALADRPRDGNYEEPPCLAELYGLNPQDHFVFPKWRDGKRTMVVVTASGGGIQAAAWTAQVLTGLEQRYPRMAESIGLISSVSGGSVGVMHYLAHRKPRLNDPDAKHWSSSDTERLQRIRTQARASSLEAIGWGMAFPDFARMISPFPLDQSIDRGWALEASWWERLGPEPGSRDLMKQVRIRDLIRPIRKGEMPPVIFNATAVETGQRVMISPVRTTSVDRADDGDYSNIHTPIDFLDYYGRSMGEHIAANPRLTTAVRLSSTFAYVTPVARPLPVRSEPTQSDIRSRLEMHLCDGGYADNTGLVSAIRLIHDLLVVYHERMLREPDFEPPFERVVFARIEPFPLNATRIVRDNSGLKGAVLGPLTALTATRVSTQAERADLELALLMDTELGRRADSRDDAVIDIRTILFRFDSRVTLDEVTESERVSAPRHSPPLSWLLAESDVMAIDAVWARYTKAFQRTGSEIPAATHQQLERSRPWITTNPRLQPRTLHPRDLHELAGEAD